MDRFRLCDPKMFRDKPQIHLDRRVAASAAILRN